MSKLIWIISAAAIAISTPAVAQGQGKGKGAAKSSHGSMAKGKVQARRQGQVQTKGRARTDASANTRARTRAGFIDRNRDGLDDRASNRYGGNACPPGLAKKTPACVPPGQAKRMFSEGQRIPSGFNSFTDFDDIPSQFRDDIPSQYGSEAYRYIVRDDSIYVVDRRTRIVNEIINLLR
jgi:hypothetical protein